MQLIGPNVRLVPIGPDHLETARQWVNDPEVAERVLRCLPVHPRDQQRWYETAVDRPDRFVFAIETLADGRHIGTTGLYHVDWIHRRAEFWIIIGPREARGRGFGTEAAKLIVGYAFDSLNLHKVYAHADEANAPALSAFRKAGFRDEALLQQEYYIRGRYHNIRRLCVFREDRKTE